MVAPLLLHFHLLAEEGCAALTLQTLILEVLGSNLGYDSGCPD
jgi:hypothetical protein